MLVEFCKGEDLVITDTMFKHHVKNLYTWKSPGDCENKNNVKNVKTYPGADLGSDHNLVVMSVKASSQERGIAWKLKQSPLVWLLYSRADVETRYDVTVRVHQFTTYERIIVLTCIFWFS